MVEQFGALIIEVGTADELKGVVESKVLLRAFLNLVRLAQNLIRVDAQLGVTRPLAVAHVLIDVVPIPPIVASVERLNMALLCEAGTVAASRPDEIVRLYRVEVEDVEAEDVGWYLCAQWVPCFPSVGGVEVPFGRRNEVGPVMAVFVMVERDEFLVGEEMLPSVSFIRGLPY